MFSQEAAAVTHAHQRSPSEGGGGGDDGRLLPEVDGWLTVRCRCSLWLSSISCALPDVA